MLHRKKERVGQALEERDTECLGGPVRTFRLTRSVRTMILLKKAVVLTTSKSLSSKYSHCRGFLSRLRLGRLDALNAL